jgi:hypothetical protein
MYIVLSDKRAPTHEMTNEELATYMELRDMWKTLSESGSLPPGLKGLPYEQEDRITLYRKVQKRMPAYSPRDVDTALQGLEEIGVISFKKDSYIEKLFSSWFKVGSEEMAEDYPWEECISDQMEQYGNKETAEKVCGSIKAKSQGLGKYKKSASRVAERYIASQR